MSSQVNSQNNNIIPPLLTAAIPESIPMLSSEDFLSKVLNVVKSGAQRQDLGQMDVSLKALKVAYFKEISPLTVIALLSAIKDSDISPQHLLPIYRHLILDLQLNNLDDFSKYNEEFCISNAQLAAEKDEPFGFCEKIKKYNIHNQEALVEIAKLIARKNGEAISVYIKDFGIESQAARIEIAKLAVQKNAFATASDIKNYCIESQEALVEIAKLAVQKQGNAFDHIDEFGIESSEALAEISLLASIQQSTNKDCFSLDKNGIIELISRWSNKNPEITHNILKKYPELKLFGLTNDLTSDSQSFFKNHNVPDSFIEKRKNLHLEMSIETDPSLKTAKRNSLYVFCSILDFADGSSSLLEKFSALFTSVQQEQNPQVQDQQLSLIAALLMHCRARNVDKGQLDEQFYLLKEVFTLKDPSLRSYLSHMFVENLTDPALCDFIKKNSNDASAKKNQYSPAHLALILLAPFITKMIPYIELSNEAIKTHAFEKDYMTLIQYAPFIERMKELLNHKFFGDRVKAQILLHNLSTLVCAPLTDAAKSSIIRDLIFAGSLNTFTDSFKKDQCNQLLESAGIVSLLIKCSRLSLLKSITAEQLPNQLNQLYKSFLNIDVPDSLILQTFAKWRRPDALLSYAGNLRSDRKIEEKVLPFLIKFAKSVLNGTFYSVRYDSSPSASKHWRMICEEAPSLAEQWKEGSLYSDTGFDIVDTDDPCDLLLSGTETPTCLKVNGQVEYNKCLAAYLLDPKIRMMAVKNKNGVIIARCMMRLLWDQTAKKFVLYQEMVYGGNAACSQMLKRACQARAEELGVALLSYSSMAERCSLQTTTLQAFPGEAPFEYVDRVGAITKEDSYTLSNIQYIYKPDNF